MSKLQDSSVRDRVITLGKDIHNIALSLKGCDPTSACDAMYALAEVREKLHKLEPHLSTEPIALVDPKELRQAAVLHIVQSGSSGEDIVKALDDAGLLAPV